MVSQAYPGYARICPGFPSPQAARVTVASGVKGLWVVWYNSDMVKVKAQGREIRTGRILIYVRVIIVLVVGINPVTVAYSWVKRGVPMMAESIQYNGLYPDNLQL